jgi:hypothetical protein
VMMLNNPLQYLKARNTAYTAVAASAGAVYNAALYQIALSVVEEVPATEALMAARATAIAANTDAVDAADPAAWHAQIRDASRLLWVKRLAAETAMKRLSSRLLWVKRLAAETAMKRLSAKLDAVDVQFPLEGEAKKSQRKINDRAREAAKEKISQALKG